MNTQPQKKTLKLGPFETISCYKDEKTNHIILTYSDQIYMSSIVFRKEQFSKLLKMMEECSYE